MDGVDGEMLGVRSEAECEAVFDYVDYVLIMYCGGVCCDQMLN